MNGLLGKTIADVWISGDKTVLQFQCTDGSLLWFYTDGDCCSNSWIEHVSGVAGLRGGRVTAYEEVDLAELNGQDKEGARNGDGDYIQVYSAKLKLEGRPDFEIEYRNASNGYYGGSIIELTEESRWPKLADLDVSRNPLLEDF